MMFALHTSPVTGHHSFWIKICLESITGICFQANLEEYGKGCLPKKKVHMEGNCPNLTLTPPPLQKQGKNRRDFFGVLDPPPPLKTREICWIFLDVLKSMNFGSKLFQTALTTIHLQTEVNKSLLRLKGKLFNKFSNILTHLNQNHILKGKNEIMI